MVSTMASSRRRNLSFSTTMNSPFFLILLLVASLLHQVAAGSSTTTTNTAAAVVDEGITKEYVHLSLKPDAKHVHFLEIKHLDLPGYIDLTGIEFVTIDDGHDDDDDDDNDDDVVFELEVEEADDLILEENEDDDDATDWGDDDDDDDWMHPPKISTKLDIAIVHIPEDCSDVAVGGEHCDFSEVGVGRKYSELYGTDLDEPYWCCSDDEIDLGLCDGIAASSYGRMMMNLTIFDGSHRSVDIPPYGEIIQTIMEPYGRIEADSKPGKYAIIIANCNEGSGREVLVRGNLKVKSSGSSSLSSLSSSSESSSLSALGRAGEEVSPENNTTQFNVAIKSFAKQSVEKTNKKSLNGSNSSSNSNTTTGADASIFGSYGMTVAILVFGFAAVAYIGRDNIDKIPQTLLRGYKYNSLELSEMNDDTPENNYVPIDSNHW